VANWQRCNVLADGTEMDCGCKKFKSQDLIVAEKLPETLALSS
jgi:hypothetical protein